MHKCRRPVRCAAEPIATKYCFKASCALRHPVTGKVRGAFVAYDKSIEVAHRVYISCQLSAGGFAGDGSQCDDDVELVLLEECPVECVREVKFVVDDDP